MVESLFHILAVYKINLYPHNAHADEMKISQRKKTLISK